MSQRLNRHGPWSTTAWRYEGIRPKGRPTDPAPILAESIRTRLSERPKHGGPARMSSSLRVMALSDVIHWRIASPVCLADGAQQVETPLLLVVYGDQTPASHAPKCEATARETGLKLVNVPYFFTTSFSPVS